MPTPPITARIDGIRRFNRFYTRRIGVLQEHLVRSPFSLTEARVLYELAHHDEATTAGALGSELSVDAGYLSRILDTFRKRGFIERAASTNDRRQRLVRLSPRGRKAFAVLDGDAARDVRALLQPLAEDAQTRLIDAMHAIETILRAPQPVGTPYILRAPQPGDMGWVVQRHGAVYAGEYGWDATFEALVAEIVAQFVRQFDPKFERCWIAERDGLNVGCVFLVRKSHTVGQLRLLLVEPSARGMGIGARLVQQCSDFARQVGFRRIVLWTNSVLHAARRIYVAAGYRLTRENRHHSFGKDLVGQTWELKL